MSKFKLLSSLPRWRRIAQKIIRERRKKRGKRVKDRRMLSEYRYPWFERLLAERLWHFHNSHNVCYVYYDFFFFFFFGPHPQHMEVPGPEVELAPQQ